MQDSDKTNQFKVNSDGQGYFAGNVGIGTPNPGSTAGVTKVLEIANNANVGLVLSTLGARREIYTDSNNALYFADTSGATRVTFSNNGNVGIGTTSPGSKLTVAGTIESTAGGVKFPDGTTQTTAASGQASIADSSVTTAKLKTATGR